MTPQQSHQSTQAQSSVRIHWNPAVCPRKASEQHLPLPRTSPPSLLVLGCCPRHAVLSNARFSRKLREIEIKKPGGHDHRPKGKDLQTRKNHNMMNPKASLLCKALHRHICKRPWLHRVLHRCRHKHPWLCTKHP